jgi:RNA recognition motif-containing protein
MFFPKNKKNQKAPKKWEEDLSKAKDEEVNFINEPEEINLPGNNFIIEGGGELEIEIKKEKDSIQEGEKENIINHEVDKDNDKEIIVNNNKRKYDWMSSSEGSDGDQEEEDNEISEEEEGENKNETLTINAEKNTQEKTNLIDNDVEKRSIFVSNIDFSATDSEIELFFKRYGDIL